ncbi:hypothetical protein MAR_001545 [Mya arenaria]|uniref:C1q domain-containing protein n=1 Tax=Mya arenaria TaxID=6604 RepID=A0ABY7FFE2_MYAAR|nr:hypothetical protein MAR_001545 [Mya arenaria]
MHCISLIFVSCFLNVALVQSAEEDYVRPETFEERLGRLEELVDIQSQTIAELKQDNTNLRDTILNSTLADEQVAFYAYLSQGKCYNVHETFIFDIEELDTTNSYANHDGVFIAPVNGVYAFSFNVVPDFWHYTQAELVVNGQVKARVFGDSHEIHDIHPTSSTVVLALNINDHVYVRLGHQTECNVISSEDHQWTYFAGWLIF